MAAVKVAKAKPAKKAPRVKGKPKVLYFGGAKLDLLKRIEAKVKAGGKDASFNQVVFDALEKSI